eukprot:748933-Hanusia_phi.AAC.2
MKTQYSTSTGVFYALPREEPLIPAYSSRMQEGGDRKEDWGEGDDRKLVEDLGEEGLWKLWKLLQENHGGRGN